MPDLNTMALIIEGMHCGGCVTRVTNALNKLQGVQVEGVEVGSARVRFDANMVSPAVIVDAVNKIGFTARAARS
jgi:copper chaperone